MTKLRVYAPKESLDHKGFPYFSERPARFEELLQLFKDLEIEISTSSSRQVRENVELAHSRPYVDFVQKVSQMDLVRATFTNWTNKFVQCYTRISPGSYNAALSATGAVCQAVDDVLTDKAKRGFCAVRPPGHHAGPVRGEGFCIFNNVAIGALYALKQGLKRVAIIDFDRHHGNGTEDIVLFEGKEKVFFVSSFQEGCKYASLGPLDEVFSLRVPIPQKSDFAVVRELYLQKVVPALEQFKPELLLLSAGFDMHVADPLTNLRLEASDYGALTDILVSIADKHCNGRIVSVLEGGYELAALRECVKEHLQALAQ
ncbi:MAG: histone deacetylase family protein [Candidatus Paceibacterota bacterium]